MVTYPIDRLRDVWTRHGLWGTVKLLPHNMARAMRACSPERRRARRRELEIDRRYGIDTTNPAALSSLDVDRAKARHGVEYRPSGFDFIRATLDGIEVDHPRYVFIDLGAGKGRALLVASHFPFRRIIGVEFSHQLTEIARANIQAYHPPDQRCRDIEARVGDAAEFEFPDEPLVIYFYNAFDSVVLRTVAAHLAESLARTPRDLLFIYVNPVHRVVLDHLDCLVIMRDVPGTVIYRARSG